MSFFLVKPRRHNSFRLFSPETLSSPLSSDTSTSNVSEHVRYQTLFSPDRIELLDTVHFTGNSFNVNITNLGNTEAVYALSHEAAESAISYRGGNTYPLASPILEGDEAVVSLSPSRVTVAAGQSATIKIEFKEPSTGQVSEFPFYSGYIVATAQGQDALLVRIPYAGVKGECFQGPYYGYQLWLP